LLIGIVVQNFLQLGGQMTLVLQLKFRKPTVSRFEKLVLQFRRCGIAYNGRNMENQHLKLKLPQTFGHQAVLKPPRFAA
jgi:hypothetical protein